MNQRLIELHLRRGRLIERIANQRAALGRAAPPVRAALYTTDRVVAGVRTGIGFIKQHPSIVTVAVATLVIVKPVRVWRWARRAFFTWQTWRKLRNIFAKFELKAG